LPRRSCSILTQLQTSHVGLNSFLHKIKMVDSPLCPLCGVCEDVEHFLLRCKRFVHVHHTLRLSLDPGTPFSLRSLLGDPSKKKAVLIYVHTTHRFSSYHD
ncbi:hypothetical protein K439DRAFT_1271679, partial [Ramaria rubella]